MKSFVEKDEIYSMRIEDIGHNGEGIGRVEGFTVFVNGGVPRDEVKVKITLVKKNYAIGKIIKLEKPSPDRIVPICELANICGGCQMQHIDYPAQLRLKRNQVKANIERIGKIENVLIHETIGMKDPYHYRNKAQFPVGKEDEGAVIGFYEGKSHDIVDMETCHIQHEINDQIIKIIRDYINQYKIDTYDEKTGKGIIRHVLTKVGVHTGQIMVVIVTNGKNLPYKEELIGQLIDKVPHIKSIVQNINKKKGNRVLGQTCITLYGEDKIIDYIGNLKFNISPLSFFQVNPSQTKVLYEKALAYAGLTGEENVYDIYCGIGTISLFLAEKAKRVYGIEMVEAAIEDAKENANINDIHNVDFFAGAAEEVVPKLYKEGHKADVVVVDPPRKGCDEKVLETIVKMNPKRIVYVSCNTSTLARDLKYLDEQGYETVEVQPVDMFPHTMHCESICLLKKKE
ncbi:23S rRNA (uracil(1939)-C(5))-methyltransferase RlmD [Marinisporobacter balticus]|uniref:23S rRNA m(5)U-1939 methyltransferase n=1 Tax=Marinisporobacter balticus TaxID=2018667 RepID=A0A4R2KEJ9_9FIRM|nr:23S rRNA (uracil(1939)-C(5))-methyltransferase RlmD [Marinisporobacter balticus]TCO68766.1 23S rRNA m(5)U-1939 methyltransferase [Marinisporobacter balticus]